MLEYPIALQSAYGEPVSDPLQNRRPAVMQLKCRRLQLHLVAVCTRIRAVPPSGPPVNPSNEIVTLTADSLPLVESKLCNATALLECSAISTETVDRCSA